jgi:hypothetical protein
MDRAYEVWAAGFDAGCNDAYSALGHGPRPRRALARAIQLLPGTPDDSRTFLVGYAAGLSATSVDGMTWWKTRKPSPWDP